MNFAQFEAENNALLIELRENSVFRERLLQQRPFDALLVPIQTAIEEVPSHLLTSERFLKAHLLRLDERFGLSFSTLNGVRGRFSEGLEAIQLQGRPSITVLRHVGPTRAVSDVDTTNAVAQGEVQATSVNTVATAEDPSGIGWLNYFLVSEVVDVDALCEERLASPEDVVLTGIIVSPSRKGADAPATGSVASATGQAAAPKGIGGWLGGIGKVVKQHATNLVSSADLKDPVQVQTSSTSGKPPAVGTSSSAQSKFDLFQDKMSQPVNLPLVREIQEFLEEMERRYGNSSSPSPAGVAGTATSSSSASVASSAAAPSKTTSSSIVPSFSLFSRSKGAASPSQATTSSPTLAPQPTPGSGGNPTVPLPLATATSSSPKQIPPKTIHEFISRLVDMMSEMEIWTTPNPSSAPTRSQSGAGQQDEIETPLDAAQDGLEKYLMIKLFPYCFCRLEEEVAANTELERRLNAFRRVVTAKHLDALDIKEHPEFAKAGDWLRRMNQHRSPQDKAECLTRSFDRLLAAISDTKRALAAAKAAPTASGAAENHEGAGSLVSKPPAKSQNNFGADEVLPCFLLLVLHASGPSSLFSNARYIEAYRCPGRFRGETAYCVTTFLTAASFWLQCDQNDLHLSQEELQELQRSVLLSQRANSSSLVGTTGGQLVPVTHPGVGAVTTTVAASTPPPSPTTTTQSQSQRSLLPAEPAAISCEDVVALLDQHRRRNDFRPSLAQWMASVPDDDTAATGVEDIRVGDLPEIIGELRRLQRLERSLSELVGRGGTS